MIILITKVTIATKGIIIPAIIPILVIRKRKPAVADPEALPLYNPLFIL